MGQELAGRYRLAERLGHGAMGEVWRALDLGLDREVAVKVMVTNWTGEARDKALARFRREGKAAARLNHPHIAAVYDVGDHEGRPFLVLELLTGPDLGTLLRRHPGGLPVTDVLEYGAQAAEGLAAAHAAGIVHRDVKPSNLVLDRGGRVKVCDFGIARLEGATAGLSVTGHGFGTPYYMPPEQINGDAVTSAADVYALGATLFHLLTGKVVFFADRLMSIITQHLQKPPPAPSSLRPGIPPALDAFLLALLAKAPAERPGTGTIAPYFRQLAAQSQDEADARAKDAKYQMFELGSARGTPTVRRAVLQDPTTVWPRGHVMGVDLGTANSVAVVLEGGEPTVIANAEGSRTTPSVVAFAENGEVLVGEVAKRQAVTNVDRTIRSVKREMGTDWKTSIDGRDFTPQQISAFVLQKLKRDAESYLGEKITSAVITVPAGFPDHRRQAVKEAGQIAGLQALRLINEPTAAALAHHWEREDEATIMVFDLGAGTFEVSLLEVGDGVVEVRATSGDDCLGGDDWDNRVVDWLVERFKNANGVDLSKDKMASQRLREAAEKAKIELSAEPETHIDLRYITVSAEGPLHLDEKLTRAEFQRMTSDLLDRTKAPFHSVLRDAGISVSDIDRVVLVGGSTRMPAVSELVKELTGGKEPNKGVNPDEVVAIGAGLRAGVLTGENKDLLELDVTAQSLGIEAKSGIFTKIIERNTTIPTKRSETFTTADDDQPSVEIQVYQGEREIAAYNEKLGILQLTGLPPAPRGVPQIEVTFDIDANGIVNVSAKDQGTGREQSMIVTGGSALPKDDIEKMMRDAEQYAEEDRRRKEEADVRNQAGTLIYMTEKVLRENGWKLPEGLRTSANEAIAEVKRALDGTDIEAVKGSADRLAQVGQRLSAAVSGQ